MPRMTVIDPPYWGCSGPAEVVGGAVVVAGAVVLGVVVAVVVGVVVVGVVVVGVVVCVVGVGVLVPQAESTIASTRNAEKAGQIHLFVIFSPLK